MASYRRGLPVETIAVWRLPDALHALRPEASERLERLNEHVWAGMDPALLELIRLRMAWLIGNRAAEQARSSLARRAGLTEEKIGELPAYASSPAFSALEREAIAFAEQFVIDVSGTTAEVLEALAAVLGTTHLRDFITAVYVVEFTQRLQMMTHLLLTAAGVTAGATSDLPQASSKTALRITDAFISRPDAFSERAVEQAQAIFSGEELAELCLDITKWSTQKIHVALGTDSADALPTNDAGVALFGFHEDGSVAGYWADV